MTDAAGPLAGVKAAVFDAYGTLFDVNAAVQRYAAAVGPDAAHLSEVWRNKQLEYSWTLSLMGRYAAFWDLTVRALDFALATHPNVDPGLRERLLDAYRDLDAYPEVPGVLAALRKRGIRTAVLTNGNAAMVDRAVASAGLVTPITSWRKFKANCWIVVKAIKTSRRDIRNQIKLRFCLTSVLKVW